MTSEAAFVNAFVKETWYGIWTMYSARLVILGIKLNKMKINIVIVIHEEGLK